MVFSDNTQLTKREQEVEAAKVLTLLDRNNDGMLDFVSWARASCAVPAGPRVAARPPS